MIDPQTYHIKKIHQETDKGLKVCKFGRYLWLPKRFLEVKKVNNGYEITAPGWIWNRKKSNC